MDNIITELWYGNIRPCEQANRGDEAFHELMSLVCKNQHALLDSLAPAQRELYEKYNQVCIEMEGAVARNAFADGFCLGARLFAAAMSTQTGA